MTALDDADRAHKAAVDEERREEWWRLRTVEWCYACDAYHPEGEHILPSGETQTSNPDGAA